MQYRPEAQDLCDAIADFLLKEVLPVVKEHDDLSYKTLVSWNMLGVVARELRDEDSLHQEIGRLQQLLDTDFQDPPHTTSEKKERIRYLTKKLCERVRKEKLCNTESQIWAHAKQTLVENLRIANPRFQTDRQASL